MTTLSIPPIKDTVALVPAAGSGTRLGRGPKAFLELGGQTLLRRLVLTLSECVERILVAVPPPYLEQARAEVGDLAELHPGGVTRQETIFGLFKRSDENIVVVHDVARPFTSKALIRRVITAAQVHAVAGAFIAPAVPVGYATGEFLTQVFPKTEILLPQLPQVYQRDVLQQAREYAAQNDVKAQTIWQLVLLMGQRIKVIPGEETNIKIITPLDWEIAQKVIAPALGWTSNEVNR